MKTVKKNIQIIHYNNTDKNKTLKENYAKYFKEINFEFMSLGTPKPNGVIEQLFATLHYWIQVMMSQAILYENLKTGLWPKCGATATKLENRNAILRQILKYFSRYGSCTHYCYRKIKSGISSNDVHVPRLLKTHTGDAYRMLNLHTKHIVLIGDIIWMNKTYVDDISNKENTRAKTSILQYGDNSYNWAHVRIDPINT